MIIVPTIRHTGTHFLLNLLGIKPKGMLWTEQESGIGGYEFAYGHLYPDRRQIYLPLIEDAFIIVPLRHPHVTARSWQARGGNLYEMIEMWEILVNEIDPWNPVYLPIDSPDRDKWLDNLNMHMGLDMKTDWDPVGSVNGNDQVRHNDIQPDIRVSDLVDRMSGFLGRFYD